MKPRLERLGLVAMLTAVGLACSGDARLTDPEAEPPPGASLDAGSLQMLVFEAGGTSPEPIRVRATVDGQPLSGVRIAFSLTSEIGRMSQPSAQTDEDGWAESWVLDAQAGEGAARATLGAASIERAIRVLRAPGAIEIERSVRAIGTPGFPPPDPTVRARVVDTEGDPMPGQQVVFAWAGEVAVAAATTDDEGWAEGRLGSSPLEAGEWPVFAIVAGRPIADVDTRATEPVAGRVVVLAIDGLRADAVSAISTPALHAVGTSGARAADARSIDPTLSVPANLSLLAGEGPASHRLFSEDLDFTPEMNRLDPLFRVGLRRGRVTAAVMSDLGHLARFDEILECRLAFGFDPLVSVSGGTAKVIDAALPLLADGGPEMLYLHLPDVDLAGHRYGWSSSEYRASVAAVDRQVARFLTALPDDVVLAVVSAHGGGGALGDFQHGSTADADTRIPLLFFGPGVVPGTELMGADLLDVAPTLAWALGWAPPERWAGTPLLDAFGGTRPAETGGTDP